MFSHTDIKWIKNVKRNHGEGWAYIEYGAGDTFDLNFSKKWGEKNAKKPNISDVIAIFQTINKGYEQPPGTYFTHLLTPLDHEIKRVESSHPIARLVGVLAKPESPIPIVPLGLNMKKPGYGACCDIDLVGHKKGRPAFSKNQKQLLIWNAFSEKNQEVFDFFSLQPSIRDDDEGVLEGALRKKLREHKYRERNPDIIRQAKELALKENRLKCEVCSFDFAIRFPELGHGFIECHHIIPISEGMERRTKIEDLALVCSNCHRMLHRRHDGRFLTIEQLRRLRVP